MFSTNMYVCDEVPEGIAGASLWKSLTEDVTAEDSLTFKHTQEIDAPQPHHTHTAKIKSETKNT